MRYPVAGALALVLLIALAAAFFAGAEQTTKPRQVLCSFWSEFIFAQSVAQGVSDIQLQLLMPVGGGCDHGYSLTPADLTKISGADLIIANGQLESFLPRVREAFPHKAIVTTADAVVLLPDEFAAHNDGDGEHHGTYNPHTWLGILNAVVMVDRIRIAFDRLLPAHSREFAANTTAYQQRLLALRGEYLAAASEFKSRKIVTFHNSFSYLARELDLDVIGTVMEVPGIAPTAAEIEALVRKIRESGAVAIFSEPAFPPRVAEMLAAELKMKVHSLDTGGNTEPTPAAYEEMMRANLKVLVEALGAR
ncbi:MAG: metal ABC transporter substrate-binding protein [Candidatus Brocadiia bacterium]